jgi:hypothetical protein
MKRIITTGLAAIALCVAAAQSAAPTGWACWAGGGKVYRAKLGGSEEALTDNVGARHATWSYDGTIIFYIDGNGDIYAMNNDGTGASKIGNGDGGGYSKIAAYRPEPKSVLYADGSKFYKINAATGEAAVEIANAGGSIAGEIAISKDGKRLAWRGGDLYKMEIGGSRNKYAGNCSASISPDGQYTTENQGGHTRLRIFKWDGGSFDVNAGVIGNFDNQAFAANSSEWICCLDDNEGSGINDNKGKGVGIVSINDEAHQVIKGTSQNIMYPRFFVGELPPISNTPIMFSVLQGNQQVKPHISIQNGAISTALPDGCLSARIVNANGRIIQKLNAGEDRNARFNCAGRHGFALVRLIFADGSSNAYPLTW